MSVQAITWAYAQTGLTGTQKFVLVTLANHANEDWECWPSIEGLSASTGFADKPVRTALKVLERERYLTRERERLKDGSLGRYRYTLERLRMPEGGLQAVKTASEKHQGNLGAVSRTGPAKTLTNVGAVSKTGPEENSNNNLVRSERPVQTLPVSETAGTTGRKDRSTKPSLEDNRQKKETTVAVETTALHSAFLEIWNMWPGEGRIRSKRKDLCLDAMVRALGDRQPAMMVEAVRRFVRTLENRKFTPALDRWIRDGKFEHFFPNAEIHELPFSNSPNDDDWRAAVRRWVDDGYWPSSRLGPAPNQVGYRGPIKPLEDILPELGNHPAAREIRSTINLRASA